MNSMSNFIAEIKEKRENMSKLLKNIQDDKVIKKVNQSLATYLEIERHLAQLGIFIDKYSKEFIPECAYHDKMKNYMLKIKPYSSYLYHSLDLDYVNILLDVLAGKYSFDIPTVNIDNEEIISLTQQFYLKNFSGSILQEAIYLLKESYILFLEVDSLQFPIPIYGRSYQDCYYESVYSFIQRWHNMSDYSSLSHEIFHGIHFKLNPNTFFSIMETKEIGAIMIGFLYYNFLTEKFVQNGNILKIIELMSASNQAAILKDNLNSNIANAYFVSSFLKIEAILVGYGMAQEYLFNREQGSQKLYQYINHFFSTSCLPNYSFLGYTKDKILELANQFVQERDACLNANYQKSL